MSKESEKMVNALRENNKEEAKKYLVKLLKDKVREKIRKL